MKNKRVRCNIVGCLGWAMQDDCRCLDHIYRKYSNVWSKSMAGFSGECGYRKMPVYLDRYEQ